MPRPFKALRIAPALAMALALAIGLLAGEARAQSLPIPGLPGGLGGLTTPEPQAPSPDSAPESAPGSGPGAAGTDQTGQAPAASAPADVAGNATQALIDILRDDTAREALIRELEAVASGATASTPTPGEAPLPAPAQPASGAPDANPAADQPAETFGDHAVQATRAAGTWAVDSIQGFWLRMQRVPTTLALTQRTLEKGALVDGLREILWPAVFLYVTLYGLRLVVGPLRRRIGAMSIGATWTKKLFLRVVSTALDLVTIPLAVTIGLVGVVIAGLASRGPNGDDVILTDAQALFVNAFVTIEAARTFLRFMLSPRTPSLRLVRLPEGGVLSLWRATRSTLYVLGYGQLVIVPIISTGVSIFVGRSVGAVLSAFIVSMLIVFVVVKRKAVADWLSPPDTEKSLAGFMRPVAIRWHWPVTLYLTYLLVTVLTQPGNVLLPLLQTTAEVTIVVMTGGMILTGLTERANQRVPIPNSILDRLPLLEERINQIRPAFLTILRFFVFVLMVLFVLDILSLQDIGGIVSSAVLQQFSSGLFSVLLIVGLLSIAWLAMTSWVDYRLNPFIGSVPTPREITLLTLMKNAVTVAIIIIGIITSLAQLGMNVGPLIASAGVIGLAISFGAQRMVEDIFSGIFIQAENAMNVGDVVDVGGTVGVVEKLTVRSVTLRDLSGVVHVIPFSASAKISNYMRDFAYHVADIGVAYREDIEDVRTAMHDAFERLRADEVHGPNIIGDLEWFGLNSFGPSELMMRARIKTVPGMQWAIGRAYNALVKEIFDARGIEIPFPHQTVYFGEDKAGHAPPLHMRVQRTPSRTAQESEPAPEAPLQADATQPPEWTPERPPEDDRPKGKAHPDEDGR